MPDGNIIPVDDRQFSTGDVATKGDFVIVDI